MRLTWLVLLGLAVSGCNSGSAVPQPESDQSSGPSRATVNGPAKVPPPDFNARTELRMVRKGEFLRVGDTIDDALNVFKQEKNASKLSELPPGWKDPNYRCAGWDAGNTGFGAITYDDRVVLAMYHEDRINEQRLQEVLNDYDNMIQIAATQVSGTRVRYWFWEDSPHRLMICAVQTPGEGLNLSVALGSGKIMDSFGMNTVAAENDRQAAEELFRKGVEAQRDQ